jgi:hypothetical protein
MIASRCVRLRAFTVLFWIWIAALSVPAMAHGQTATTVALQVSSACPTVGCVTTLTATVTAGTVAVHPGLVVFCEGNPVDC